MCIIDKGHGIPDETINQIFDPFFTTKTTGSGTGLGMSVVHGIMEAHNGRVTVKSKYGEGTTVCMVFPVVHNEKDNKACKNEGPLSGDERILVVDDEEKMLEILDKSLSKHGYKVSTSNSSIDALEILTKKPDSFDLIISDYSMPELSGIELFEKLKDFGSKIPFIMITGYKNINPDTFLNDDQINIKILYKPINISELTATVRSFSDN